MSSFIDSSSSSGLGKVSEKNFVFPNKAARALSRSAVASGVSKLVSGDVSGVTSSIKIELWTKRLSLTAETREKKNKALKYVIKYVGKSK